MRFCTEPVFVDPRQATAVVCVNFAHFCNYIQDRSLRITVKVAIVSEPPDILEITEEMSRFVDPQTLNDLIQHYQYRKVPLIRERPQTDPQALRDLMFQQWSKQRKIRLTDVQSY